MAQKKTMDRAAFVEESQRNGVPPTVSERVFDLMELRVALVAGATAEPEDDDQARVRARYVDTLCSLSLELARQSFQTANVAMLCLPKSAHKRFREDWIKAIGSRERSSIVAPPSSIILPN